MRTKIVKEYIDHGLGFPVKLTNVTMVYARGEWMPRLAYKAIEKQVALVLSRLARPLTGDEVRFLRHYFSMTLTQFAAHFGVSHVAVHHWEGRGAQPTAMQWSTEKDLRLFIQARITGDWEAVGKLYGELKAKPAGAAGTARPLAVTA